MISKWIAAPAVVATMLYAQAEAATVSEWRETIDHVVADIRLNHPEPFAKTGELTFTRSVEALKDALPRLTEEQRMIGLMRIVASVGDGHTQLNPAGAEFSSWYPIRIWQFSDGYFITAAHQSVRDLVGAQVLQVAGRPVAEVAEQARDLRGADNAFDRMNHIEVLFNAPLMHGLGFTDDQRRLHIQVRLASGRVVDRVLTPAPFASDPFISVNDSIFDWSYRSEVYGPPIAPFEQFVTAYHQLPTSAYRQIDLNRPPHLMYRRLEVARAMPDHDAFYIQINGVDPEENIPFLRQQLALIDQQRPRRVILDIRNNTGGDGSRMMETVHEFVQREANPPWREFYLITGRKTFSAGVIMTDAFLKNVRLTVVGEPAGAALNHFGDAHEHRYSSPNIVLNVSTLRHQLSDSDDHREIIPVDVPAPMSFADYAAGRDPAVDPILAGAEMRSIPEIARTDGGAAARRAYEDRRARFGNLAWYAPPAELAMRAACDGLVEQHRNVDAVETCRLTTEMHPYIWNSWYNLSLAQHAAGQERNRAASLKCVLALDPLNPNLDEAHQVFAAVGADVPVAQGCPIETVR